MKKGEMLTTIPKVSKEWELSLDIKLNGRTAGWTNVIHMTTGGNCCDRGNRIPAIFVHSNSNRMHITTQIDWDNNRRVDSAVLVDKADTTVVLKQKKEADNNYYYYVHVNGKQHTKQKNRMPQEWRNVKMYTSDPFYNPAKAEIKNIIFKNTGDFAQCSAVCNKKLSDPAFQNLQPGPPKSYPTFTPVRNKLIDTIPSISKEYKISFEIQPKGKIGGWSNVLHFTTDHNCCHPGSRIPGIWFYSNSYRLLISSAIDNNGNYYYSKDIPTGKFTKVVIQQKKVGNDYQYSVTFDGVDIGQKKINTIPREYYVVKVYASDNWYSAANAEVKNLVFENLVGSYPCAAFCKANYENVDIDGEKVRAVSYERKYCKDKNVYFEGSIPPTVRSTRLSCLSFYYKVDKSDDKYYCRLSIKYNKNSHIDYKHLDKARKVERGEWIKYEKTVSTFIPYGVQGGTIGINSRVDTRCPKISFANLKLLDGVC